MERDSQPASLDDDVRKQRRRMSDDPHYRLQQWADSAILKVMQYVVTAVAIPLIGWSIGIVLDRIKDLEKTVQTGNLINAQYEYRMAQTERVLTELSASNKLLTEKVMSHDFELRTMRKVP